MKWTFVLVNIFLLFPLLAIAGNSKREQEYADHIKQTLKMGEVVSLQQNGRSFLAIHTKTVTVDHFGSVIILHDRNGFPDRHSVVHALRTTLPQHQWATLALQMPMREMGAAEHEYYDLFPEAKARLVAAVEFLRKAKEQNIVIVGYGLGALMGLYGISDGAENINALAAISLAVPDSSDQHVQTLAFIEKIQLPLLDIYAEHDLPAVLNSARKRKLAAVKNPDYRQYQLDDADHLFRHSEMLLTKRVYSWLSRGFMVQ